MSSQAPAIPQTLGHYRIIEKIGAGGMGEVYRAHDEHLDREVALKVLPPGALENEAARKRFRQEAMALSKLNHPNIATIHDFDTQEGVDFLVMELVRGATLAERMQVGQLSIEEIVTVGTQLAQGLAAAHAEGVVHRDIKPQNVRMTADGRWKILDFGLAKLIRPVSESAETQSLSQSVEIAGTVPYMAPEQLRAQSCDARTDIYAVGAVLYELATRQRAFPGVTTAVVIDAVLNRAVAPPGTVNPKVPPALEAAILKALEKNPAHRQQSARELLAELQRLTATQSSHPAIPAWLRRWYWPLARRPRAVLASVMTIVAVLLVVLWFHGRTPVLAFAARDFVLIGDFENQTGDAVFDKSLSNAFSTSLGQSAFANVYSRMQMLGALKRMQRPTTDKVDEALAQEIALREGLRVAILPSITGVGENYRLAAKIRDVASGRDVRTEVVGARGKEQVLDALDKLAAAVRNDLGESLQEISKSKPLTVVTTRSLEALRQFSIGIEKQINMQIDEAKVYYENALRIDPEFTAARAQLGAMHVDQAWFGRPNFDAVEGRRLLAEAVKHVDGLTEREKYGILAFSADKVERDPEKAVGYYKALLALYPDDAVTHHNLGWLYMQRGRLPEAIAEEKEAIRLDRKLVLAYVNLGAIYLYRMGEMGPAAPVYREILQIDPENAWAHDALGWINLGRGELAAAQTEFERAVAANPKGTFSRYRLAHAHRLQGEYQQAIAALEPIRQLDPSDTSVFYDLGANYEAVGAREKAREFFDTYRLKMEAITRKNPGDANNQLALAAVYAHLGQKQRADSIMTKALARAPGLHFSAATVLALLGRKKEAIDQLEMAINAGNKNFIFMKIHSDLQSVASDPRFIALLVPHLKN